MNLSEQLRKAIKRLVDAEVADSWAGCGSREDMANCELELMQARAHVEELLKRVRSRREKA